MGHGNPVSVGVGPGGIMARMRRLKLQGKIETSGFRLRPYQARALRDIRRAFRRPRGLALDEPTRAELLCVALDCSLKAPLGSTGQCIAERLFAELFPERAAAIFDEATRAREPWPGAVDDELATMRRKFKVER